MAKYKVVHLNQRLGRCLFAIYLLCVQICDKLNLAKASAVLETVLSGCRNWFGLGAVCIQIGLDWIWLGLRSVWFGMQGPLLAESAIFTHRRPTSGCTTCKQGMWLKYCVALHLYHNSVSILCYYHITASLHGMGGQYGMGKKFLLPF